MSRLYSKIYKCEDREETEGFKADVPDFFNNNMRPSLFKQGRFFNGRKRKMNSLFQNNYESENDKRLDKKFSYNYQVIKRMYPKASELPEEEVREIIRKYY